MGMFKNLHVYNELQTVMLDDWVQHLQNSSSVGCSWSAVSIKRGEPETGSWAAKAL